MTADSQDAAPLPEGWHLIPPETLGTPGIAFAAAHERPDAGFTANVTVGVQRSDDPALAVLLGAEALRAIEAAEQDVTLARREQRGDLAVAQEVHFTTTVDGAAVPMTQVQEFVAVPGADGGPATVWTLSATATRAQAEALGDGLAELLGALRAEIGAS
ncbi:hypothetical protein [Cellulomonas hominis]|uniref:hypothetical protein n=1 Tax=Cellulomonas hominis TaxID=156981 RepID=UPI001B908033|nr:hypothetical protein [Cellulomonas hominis]VTR75808.1 hypothetical protein CHMI_00561 [Cellulomonas hominis]